MRPSPSPVAVAIQALAVLCVLAVAVAARAESVEIPGPEGVVLKASLYRPVGAIVGPAIVALHGCGGLFVSRDRQWADRLAGAGHIVLFPNSFTSRGLGSQCNTAHVRRLVAAGGLRRLDAYAAARWLLAQPGTPQGGVVLMGWSDGGSTTLAAGAGWEDTPRDLIRGLVAFYPGCREASVTANWRPVAPLLVLMGGADDWTPVAPCRALADKLGAAMTLVVYPGAYHDFDAPDVAERIRNSAAGQVHVGTNAAARADALARVPAFIAALPERP